MVENKTSVIYYTATKGKVVRTYKEEQPGLTKERVNARGNIVHEARYDRITGLITNIAVRDRAEYGKEWNVTLCDSEGNVEVLQFNYSSGYANGFLRALPNIDLTREVSIIPNMKKEGDKEKHTIFLSQDGKAVKWYYTKEHPNGLPDWTQVKRKGKMEWDDSDQMEFLENMVTNTILPKLPKVAAAPAPAAVPAGHEEDAHVPGAMPQSDDEMPF